MQQAQPWNISMETTDKVILYGASGHAKVIMDTLFAQGIDVECFVDDNQSLSEFMEKKVLHTTPNHKTIIISIGNCNIRRKIAENLPTCNFAIAIHPSAVISPSAIIGEGTVVMAGSVINSEARIGKHCIINTRASIDHDCIVEDFCHIAPGCAISGGVHIGEGSWIGVGTSIIQGIHIGKNCMIGAGSVVVRDIPDNAKAYGVPCKVVNANSLKHSLLPPPFTDIKKE